MVLACWITSPCAADKRITGASLPRRCKRRLLSAYLVVMKQGIQHQQVKGANGNLPYGLTSLWWGNSLELLQLCDIFNRNNSGGLQGFRLKLITGCFAYTRYASRMARFPLNKVCYKKKKKRMTHIFPLQQEYVMWHSFIFKTQQLCHQQWVLRSRCSEALLDLGWYNSFSLGYYAK